MARISLKSKIRDMEVDDTIKAPKDYEGITIRNYAACLGKELNRRYSVKKQNNTFIVIRNA